ncbi:HAD family hydrolase [Demequina mangrovi]|uniref:Haloacid dehalogenase superfamily, subfamily IA, variant 3 with third motif having DD or ED n=1 Tax=Demequina mangrovi TaxID=1043493 RepID=A0A1H6THT8_9MICO|nr:HAD family phosphatase [Demequina mangrovi]SEI78856.1 haloacid dehalogenase superfamily, subfamily IA, variant 3 with third motif having DD or ED [Demequina mangrovi]
MNEKATHPAAVLWDMDGTLIDSEPYWITAETELARSFGVGWTHEDGLQLVGNPLLVSAQVLIDRGVDLEPDEVITYLLGRVTAQVRERTPWMPDARRLLDDVVSAGIPCALVTMSYAMLAEAFVSRAPDAFAVVVTGDQVTHGKPHPESYLTAAERLGVDIGRCVAIEDSPAGIGAAHASGAATIGVRRLIPVEKRPGLSRVASLDGIDVDTLGRLVEGEVIEQFGDTA